jgi:hypothetical protein
MTLTFSVESQCEGKRWYRTKPEAKHAALTVTSSPATNGTYSRRKARAYRCPHCARWHVGHLTGGR